MPPESAEVDSVTETYNPILLHYTSSPIPRRRDPSPLTEHQVSVGPRDPQVSPRSAAPIDITPISSRSPPNRLSMSAPAPSALSSDSELSPLSLRSCKSESETSSPSVVNTPQCPSVKHHKMVLENLCNKPMFKKRGLPTAPAVTQDDSPEFECPSPLRSTSGIVKNLKKEFEAKSSSKLERSPENSIEAAGQDSCCRQKRDGKIRSLPSSPVIPHNESKIQASPSMCETSTRESRASAFVKRSSEPTPSTISSDQTISGSSLEDLSVKVLVGKYEFAKPETKRHSEVVQFRGHNHRDRDRDHPVEHPPAKSRIAPDLARRSAPTIINNHAASMFDSSAAEAPGRPPSVPSPSQVVASVVAKAASKKQQQHGRTHPLARLQVRPRHSSPVYNTM